MKIHFGLILFFISLSLFVSSKAEGGNRQIKETERGISVEVETLNVQLKILSLLEQMKEQNNQVIKEVSSGLNEVSKQAKENSKVMKEISSGLKEVRENTKEISNGQKEMKEISKQVRDNSEFIKDFTTEIKDNTNGIKENTDETKKITLNIKEIVNEIGENIEKIKEIPNDIKQNTTDGIKEIVNGVTNSTEYLEEIKDCLIPAKNCDDLRQNGDEKSGIRTVHPYPNSPRRSINVWCDQQTEGGGWTVFQARENLPERENFERNWRNYSHGFGNINGEFWMGLELINVMTKLDVMELRVDLEDDIGEKRFAKYESFSVEDEDEKFKLNIGSYNGTAGDSLRYHDQRPFSTVDQDNDRWSRNCAVSNKGAWWYGKCHRSNLNGFPHVGKYSSSYPDGIDWDNFRSTRNSMAKTKMMFRLSGRTV